MNSERFPLDFDALNRGDYLPVEAVEKALLIPRDDPQFRLRSMDLAKQIQRHFEERGEGFVTVRGDNDGLRILRHHEQAANAQRREMHGIRKVVTSQIEAHSVDLQQLDDGQRERFERWKHRNAFRTQQMLKPPPPRLE